MRALFWAVIFSVNVILLSAFRPMPNFLNKALSNRNKVSHTESNIDSKFILAIAPRKAQGVENQDARGLMRSFVVSSLVNMFYRGPRATLDIDMSGLPLSQKEEINKTVSSLFHLDLF